MKRSIFLFLFLLLTVSLFIQIIPIAKAEATLKFSTGFEDATWRTGDGDADDDKLWLKDIGSAFYMDNNVQVDNTGKIFIDDGTYRVDSPVAHGGSKMLGAEITSVLPSGGIKRAELHLYMQRDDSYGEWFPPDPWIDDQYFMRAYFYLTSDWELEGDFTYNWAAINSICVNSSNPGDNTHKAEIHIDAPTELPPFDEADDYLIEISGTAGIPIGGWGTKQADYPEFSLSANRGRWVKYEIYVKRGPTATNHVTLWLDGVQILDGGGFPALNSQGMWQIVFPKQYFEQADDQPKAMWIDDLELWDDIPEGAPEGPPPLITLISPIGSYYTNELPLIFTINDTAVWIGYSVDGAGNVTIEGNTTISAYLGTHSIIVYANNTGGEMGKSSLEYFVVSYELTFIAYPESNGSFGFNIFVPNGDEIGFQTISYDYDFTFLISVTSGTWNGTSGTLSMDTSGGSLGFHANDTSTLRLYSLTTDELTIGATGGTLTETATNDYSLTVTNGNDLLITWFHPLPSYLDYTMFGVGMFGVGLLVGCPIWAIKKVKDEGILEPDSIQRIGLAGMLMLIGFGLVIAWLWL